MKNSVKNVAIVGLGLIGGSIAKALKFRLPNIRITAISKNRQVLKKASAEGTIDEIAENIKNMPDDCDLIILAQPVSEIIKSFGILNGKKIRSLVIDVGSTKKEIMESQKLNAPEIRFVATHPLAGKEKNGFENASLNLFQDKKWVICPSDRNKKSDLKSVARLITLLGGKPVSMSGEKHDEILSVTSHLNLVIASILTNKIIKRLNYREIKKLLPGSFLDMTRMAEMSPKIKTDIIFTNRNNLLSRLEELNSEIILIRQMIENGDNEKLNSYFTLSKLTRERLFG